MDINEILALLRKGQNRGRPGYDTESINTVRRFVDSLPPDERVMMIQEINKGMSETLTPGESNYFGGDDYETFVGKGQINTNRRGRGGRGTVPDFNKPDPAPAPAPAPEQPAPNQPAPNQPAPAPAPNNPNFDEPEELEPMEVQAKPFGPAINANMPFNIRNGVLSPVQQLEVPPAEPFPEDGDDATKAAWYERKAQRDAIIQQNNEAVENARKQMAVSISTPEGGRNPDGSYNRDLYEQHRRNKKQYDRLQSLNNPLKAMKMSSMFQEGITKHPNHPYAQYESFNDFLSQAPNQALSFMDVMASASARNAKPILSGDQKANYHQSMLDKGFMPRASKEGGIEYFPSNSPQANPQGIDPKSDQSSITFDDPYKVPKGPENPFSNPYSDLESKGLVKRDAGPGGTGDYFETQSPRLNSFANDDEEERRRRNPQDLMGSWGSSYGSA